MGLVWKLLILIVVVVAILTQLEAPQNKWVAKKSMTLKAKPEDALGFVVSLDYVNKWFPFVHQVKEADGRLLGVGKKIAAIYEVPFYGDYSMIYRIMDFKKDKLIVIEGDNILKPRIEFHFVKLKENETQMTVLISFRCFSYMFQYVIGPVLNFVVNQKLQHALFLLQAIFPY